MTKTVQLSGNPFKVGDILHHQFHYTMSFPQFFKVIRKTPKSVVVVEIGKRMFENRDGYGQAGTEVPDESRTYGREKRCSLRENYRGEIGALVDKGCIAFKWDGQPKEFYGD